MSVISRHTPHRTPPQGMRAFYIVWSGQVVSLFGSALTAFAITFWAWLETGEVTALALAALFNFGPTVILSPIAGALVDRWNRKLVMMLSDLAAGLSTVVLFLLYSADALEIWHIYAAGAFASAFQAFQFPAYSAAITMMLPKEQYTRASGMIAMAESGAQIFAPALAGALIVVIGIQGVMVIDIFTFVVAVSALAFVDIPQPKQTEEGAQGRGSLLKESVYGFRYIAARPSLLGLQTMFFFANLFGGFAIVLIDPMVLANTGSSEVAMGTVRSSMAVGGLLGALVISIWGGPKRRVHGVLLGMAATSLLGQVTLGLGQILPVWMLGVFLMAFFINILNASNQAIWQAKVAPDVQGRVFAARRLIAQITGPFAMICAGPLADRVFEPAMRYQGALANLGANPVLIDLFAPVITPDNAIASIFAPIVGVGAGSGIGAILIITGLLGTTAALSGYLFPFIRDAETILPDYDTSDDVPPVDPDASGGAVVTEPQPPNLPDNLGGAIAPA